MINEETLKALSTALLTHRNVNKQYENWPEINRMPYERAANLIKALQDGDMIASLWSVEDVYSLKTDDDGEPDGSITVGQARQVLQLADRNHDASIGINWDTLRCHLDEVLEAGHEATDS